MQKIEMKNIEKNYGNRRILDIEDLKIFTGEKIGIVGNNGEGKTTLLKIIKGLDKDYDGQLIIKGSIEYVSQLDEAESKFLNGKYSSIFEVANKYNKNMSGGEKTRFKIAQALSKEPEILILDEPTSNLDMDGIELVSRELEKYLGTILVVSHDRTLLDRVCDKILELDGGKIKSYKGNYSDYKTQKEMEVERASFEYNRYVNEKNRLLTVRDNVDKKSSSIRRTPSRMGNSEARLHRMGGQKNKMKLDNTAKALETRIEHLEVKEKPKEEEKIKLEILETSKVHSKVLISGEKINKKFGKTIIFDSAKIEILNNKKYALIGKNGSGKTSLIDMIIKGESLEKSQSLKLGYFNQEMKILDDNKTILENIMETTIYDENFVRLVLARLLFRGNRVYEQVANLSGGEKVKVSLAKIILEDINMLILDEPTNYLDIASLEVIEEILKDYDGSVLIVSHDRAFIDNIVDEIFIIEDKKIINFAGNITEYEKSKNKPVKNKGEENKKLLLENEMAQILGRLSGDESEASKKLLNDRYIEIMREIREL